MRSILLALAAVAALAANAPAAHADISDVPLGPGSTITGILPQPGGFTTYVVHRGDGTFAVVSIGPRGGVRSYVVIDNPPVRPGGYSYELNGRTIVVPPRRSRPFNQVDPKAMYRLSRDRLEDFPDHAAGNGVSRGGEGAHGGGDR